VIKSLVQVCLPKSIGQNGMINYVPAKCDQITCTNMFALDHRPEMYDTLSSYQVRSNHEYVSLRA
jgi:hypothetical protein